MSLEITQVQMQQIADPRLISESRDSISPPPINTASQWGRGENSLHIAEDGFIPAFAIRLKAGKPNPSLPGFH